MCKGHLACYGFYNNICLFYMAPSNSLKMFTYVVWLHPVQTISFLKKAHYFVNCTRRMYCFYYQGFACSKFDLSLEGLNVFDFDKGSLFMFSTFYVFTKRFDLRVQRKIMLSRARKTLENIAYNNTNVSWF